MAHDLGTYVRVSITISLHRTPCIFTPLALRLTKWFHLHWRTCQKITRARVLCQLCMSNTNMDTVAFVRRWVDINVSTILKSWNTFLWALFMTTAAKKCFKTPIVWMNQLASRKCDWTAAAAQSKQHTFVLSTQHYSNYLLLEDVRQRPEIN